MISSASSQAAADPFGEQAGRRAGDTKLTKAGEAARMLGRPMGIAASDRWVLVSPTIFATAADLFRRSQELGLALQEGCPFLPRQLDLQSLLCHEQPPPLRHDPQQHPKRCRLSRLLLPEKRPSGLHLLPRPALPLPTTTTASKRCSTESVQALSGGKLGQRPVNPVFTEIVATC